MTLSNSQVEKLGKRLRTKVTDEDLRWLDEFRQTYNDIDECTYGVVRGVLASQSDLVLTKRKRKTQQSIVDKLHRQPKLRLPQMQDIAGCRIVLQSGTDQAQCINNLLVKAFENELWPVQSKERQAKGYRAIHIIVKQGKQFYEIQLRTFGQDVWANVVERVSDKHNTLKYGGNPQEQDIIAKLEDLSEAFVAIDEAAHRVSITAYHQQIKTGIEDVLSH